MIMGIGDAGGRIFMLEQVGPEPTRKHGAIRISLVKDRIQQWAIGTRMVSSRKYNQSLQKHYSKLLFSFCASTWIIISTFSTTVQAVSRWATAPEASFPML